MLLTIAFACFIVQVVCWLLLPSSAASACATASEMEAEDADVAAA
jgi:hypothetical protein